MAIIQYVNNFSYTVAGTKSSSQGYIDEAGFIAALKAAFASNNYISEENPVIAGYNNDVAGRIVVPVTVTTSAGDVKAKGYLINWDSGTDNKVYFSSGSDDTLTSTAFSAGDIITCRERAEDVTGWNLVDNVHITEANYSGFNALGLAVVAPHTVVELDSGLTSLTSLTINISNSVEKFHADFNSAKMLAVPPRYTMLLKNKTATDSFGTTFSIQSSYTYDVILWEVGSAPAFSSSYDSLFVELLFMGGSGTLNTWLGRYHLFNA